MTAAGWRAYIRSMRITKATRNRVFARVLAWRRGERQAELKRMLIGSLAHVRGYEQPKYPRQVRVVGGWVVVSYPARAHGETPGPGWEKGEAWVDLTEVAPVLSAPENPWRKQHAYGERWEWRAKVPAWWVAPAGSLVGGHYCVP